MIGQIILEIFIGIMIGQLAHLNYFFKKIKNNYLRINVKIGFCLLCLIGFPIISIIYKMNLICYLGSVTFGWVS